MVATEFVSLEFQLRKMRGYYILSIWSQSTSTTGNGYSDGILTLELMAQQYLDTLKQVLSCLDEAGLKLQKNCMFMVSEVVYLGCRIDDQGYIS